MASPAFKGVAGRCPADRSGDRRSNACGLIAEQFDFVQFDTSELLIEKNRAAVEVPIRYRHRNTGALFESTKANFWRLEDGWPGEANRISRHRAGAGLRRRSRRLTPGSRKMERNPLPPALQGSEQLRRRIAVGGQPEFFLHVPHPHAGRGADYAVNLAHVIAALGEDLLQ